MILVTGANGFVGSALLRRLTLDYPATSLVGTVRGSTQSFPIGVKTIKIGDLLPTTEWLEALQGVSAVVHCAARVHVMKDKSTDPMAEFRCINVDGTLNLARQAAAAGVKRLVFLSSIKVNGESTELGFPFTACKPPAPKEPYGVSKLEAEKSLIKISIETGMEVVIIRSPLVYGPGAKANFDLMVRILIRGVPLPLAAVTYNRRSLVGLDNLVDLIVTCIIHPKAANQTFLVSDGEDLSTADLIRRIGAALGRPANLFYVPNALLKLGAVLINKLAVYQRLCSSLQLDITKTRQLLDWSPPLFVDEGLRRAVVGRRR